MTDALIVPDSESTSNGINFTVESQFSEVLEYYQLHNHDDPFRVIREFKSISARKALELSTKLIDEENEVNKAEFDNWDLETRLWHLVEILYSFRYSKPDSFYPQFEFSSFYVKKENWLRANPEIKELSLIIYWLQENSKSVYVSGTDFDNIGKWQNTRLVIANKDLNALTKNHRGANIIDELDADAPLRSGKSIDVDDDLVDSKIFSLIYKLVIANRISEAIDLANNTSNFTLALILVGAQQDYIDPVVDKQTLLNNQFADDNDMLLDDISFNGESVKTASGGKHKLLWYQTVYMLSQQQNLNHYEKLIYTYLSGNDINANLKLASDNWEEYLLIYLNQLFVYNLKNFLSSEESISYPSISPQSLKISEILNSLLKADNEVSQQSKHPIRVIIGSVMINQVSDFLNNEIKSISKSPLAQSPNLLRIITHLSIFLLILDENTVSHKNINKIITFYVSKLQERGLTSLIPVYLSFIPNEKDARECYSLFLSTIIDPIERAEQITISKKFSKFNYTAEESSQATTSSTDDFNENEDKMVNVLRRTVERVMKETEPYYNQQPSSDITVEADVNNIPSVDLKLFRSVEWFYDSKYYDDAITSTIVVFRRFLLTGKLSSVKAFSKNKNFKSLIKNYDSQFQTRYFTNSNLLSSITEETKEELLQYDLLVNVLSLIDEWKNFLSSNKDNYSSDNSWWKSKDLEKSIEKTSHEIHSLIYKWFTQLTSSSNVSEEDRTIFKEFRSIYVPYLIMELLSIYEVSRKNNWTYIKKAFNLITEVAKDKENDFLLCFLHCGRLKEFVRRSGEIAVVASERGVKGIFYDPNDVLGY